MLKRISNEKKFDFKEKAFGGVVVLFDIITN